MSKYIIALLLFLGSLFGGKAQVPDYFGNNPQWIEQHDFLYSCCYHSNISIYYLNGTTTINGVVYHNVFKRNSYGAWWFTTMCNNPPPPPYNNCGNGTPPYQDNLYAYLRQDSLKIFMFIDPSQPDSLLYNFDLHVGSTVNQGILGSNLFVVQSIDSILTGNGYRKKFDLGTTTLYEGIGHSEGFLSYFIGPNISGNMDALNCYNQNDTAWYSNGGYCDLTLSQPSLSVAKEIQLFPNPAKDEVRVSLNGNHAITSVLLLDLSGRRHNLGHKLTEQSELLIDLREVEAGVYFLEIKTGNQRLVKRLIKQ